MKKHNLGTQNKVNGPTEINRADESPKCKQIPMGSRWSEQRGGVELSRPQFKSV